jgi:hypothetical protein
VKVFIFVLEVGDVLLQLVYLVEVLALFADLWNGTGTLRRGFTKRHLLRTHKDSAQAGVVVRDVVRISRIHMRE